jgi:hypothetical protein
LSGATVDLQHLHKLNLAPPLATLGDGEEPSPSYWERVDISEVPVFPNREAFSLAHNSKAVVVFGGVAKGKFTASMAVLDLPMSSHDAPLAWRLLNLPNGYSWPCPRACASLVAVGNGRKPGGTLVLFGGTSLKRHEENMEKVAAFDWTTEQWAFPKCSGCPHNGRVNCSAAVLGRESETVAFYGGLKELGPHPVPTFSILCTQSWAWSQPSIQPAVQPALRNASGLAAPSLPEHRYAAPMLFDGIDLIVFGGERTCALAAAAAAAALLLVI